MKKIQPVFLTVMIIGFLSIIFAVYSVVTGDNWTEHILSIVLGISLIGTAYIGNEQKNKKEV